jgi:hypothetical protein
MHIMHVVMHAARVVRRVGVMSSHDNVFTYITCTMTPMAMMHVIQNLYRLRR